MQRLMDTIEERINLGTFSYRDFFPSSKHAARFEHAEQGFAEPRTAQVVTAVGTGAASTAKATPLFKDFVETWFAEKDRVPRRGVRGNQEVMDSGVAGLPIRLSRRTG